MIMSKNSGDSHTHAMLVLSKIAQMFDVCIFDPELLEDGMILTWSSDEYKWVAKHP